MSIYNLNKTMLFGLKTLASDRVVRSYMKKQLKKIDIYKEPKSTPLERSTPEKEGISSDRIFNFISDLENDMNLDIHNIMILKNGKIITEAQFGAYDMSYPRYSFSACKSVTSLAIGLLYDEGKLRFDDRIVDILKEEMPSITKIFTQRITVKDVITMRSTITFNETTTSVADDWLNECFTTPLLGTLGESFNYNSVNTYILSRIVCKLSGKSMSEYLDEKLFQFMGIYDYYWEKCPKGYEIGGWGLYIKHEDFAKLGMLVMNKGKYNGKQLISEEYITLATTDCVKTPDDYGDFNYGYQIWVNRTRNIYLFNGMFGQNVCIIPDNNMVIVSGAGIDEMFQQSGYYKYLAKYFFDKIEDDGKGNYDILKNYLTFLKTPASANPVLMYSNIDSKLKDTSLEKIDGKTYFTDKTVSTGVLPFIISLVSNEYSHGIHSVSFKLDDSTLYITFNELTEEHVIPFKENEIVNFTLKFGENEYRVATVGTYASDEEGNLAIKFRLCFLEMPSCKNFKLLFKDGKLVISYFETPGYPFVKGIISSSIENLKDNPILKTMIPNIDVNSMTTATKKRFADSFSLSEKGTTIVKSKTKLK